MNKFPPERQKRNDTRTYTPMQWAKGYAAWVAVLPLYLFLGAFALTYKRVPDWLLRKLLQSHNYTTQRPMDFRIPPDLTVPVYMERWWYIARNAFFNIYYHHVRRGDDDRALHDHPWWNFSIILEGGYFEHTIEAGGVSKRQWYGPGSVRFRRHGRFAHRLELATAFVGGVVGGAQDQAELPVKTIFITGPVLRRWGFHHPTGWVDAYDWDAFCSERGIEGMKVDGGSDAAISARNKLTRTA